MAVISNSWPTDVPETPERSGYAEDRSQAMIESEVEVGPNHRRRRFTIDDEFIKAPFILDRDEAASLETFYFDTLKGGVEKFNWTHPRTGQSVVARFKGGEKFRLTPLGAAFKFEHPIQIMQRRKPLVLVTGGVVGDRGEVSTLDTEFDPRHVSYAIEATTASTTPGAGTFQVLHQLDDGSESNRIRVARDDAQAVRLIVTVGGSEVVNLNLGTVGNSTALKLALAAEKDDFAASLNGGAAVFDKAGGMPTLTHRRIKQSFTGEAWGGSVAENTEYAVRRSNEQLVTDST